jgi:predicted metal-dependent hydrolase
MAVSMMMQVRKRGVHIVAQYIYIARIWQVPIGTAFQGCRVRPYLGSRLLLGAKETDSMDIILRIAYPSPWKHQMPIEVKQIIRSKRKTLALIVKPDGSLIVRAPLRASEKSIREFVEKNAGWVAKKQAEALAALPAAPKQYLAGETFTLLGVAYPLEIVKGQKKPLILENGFKLAESAQSNAKLIFERWYRAQAKVILSERVDLYARRHGFEYKKIGITSARTRWGSCSASGSLNFSWRLIMAPLEAVDYVIVHELVHTVYHNHSKQFWGKVRELMPDYTERRKWLRRNATHLTL